MLQTLPVEELDVKVTELPEHRVVEPLDEIVGVVGDELTVTFIPTEVTEHPPEITVTE